MITAPQQALIDSPAALTIGIAGPGSGKTFTLIQRYARWRDLDTVIVTFTNAGANELRKRIKDAGLPEPRFVGTLHSFCLSILRAARPGLTLLDEADAEESIGECIKELRSKATAKGIRTALNTGASRSHDERIAVMRYRAKLRTENAEDFDTLLLSASEFLEHHPVSMDHLMVDEYQDSGELDHEIYGKLRAGKRFIVGDTDQAIYGFRGGKLKNLLDLTETPGAFVGLLEENFRSAIAVTTAANNLISYNRARIDKETIGDASKKGNVEIWQTTHEGEEAGAIVDWIREHPQTAVLCRYNHDRIRIENALRSGGVDMPAPPRRHLPAHWKLACTGLQLLAQPENQSAAMRFLRATVGPEEALRRRATAGATGQPLRPFPAVENLRGFCEVLGLDKDTRALLAKAADATPDAPLNEAATSMLLWLRQDAAELPPPASAGPWVMTVHASKGLEFDNVIVQGVDQAAYGRTPEEDRRLLYVAITRARSWAILTTTGERQDPYTHKATAHTPSRFLSELTRKA